VDRQVDVIFEGHKGLTLSPVRARDGVVLTADESVAANPVHKEMVLVAATQRGQL
jgi:hypothetical protein